MRSLRALRLRSVLQHSWIAAPRAP